MTISRRAVRSPDGELVWSFADELEWLYGNTDGYAHLAWKDQSTGDKKTPPIQVSYQWPAEREKALGAITDWAARGVSVWRSSALSVSGKRRLTETAHTRFIAFESDKALDFPAQRLLRRLKARRVCSGTEGHYHWTVEVSDHQFTAQEARDWAKSLANQCGVTGKSEDGGKWSPNDYLRVPGTMNSKHGEPCVIEARGDSITFETLRSLVTLRHHDADSCANTSRWSLRMPTGTPYRPRFDARTRASRTARTSRQRGRGFGRRAHRQT